MTVLLDDHLLRDWLTSRDDELARAVGDDDLATTNLWYARLCRAAARAGSGALLSNWTAAERDALVGALVALPPDIAVHAMKDLAWTMATVAARHHGLSLLGAEAIAAAEALDARILVSSRDDGPGIRAACRDRGVPYDTVGRASA